MLSYFRDITNIDISPVAIKKMQEINTNTRPSMKFLQMDATQMSFENEQFSVALDKGTLDALFVDDTQEVKDTIDKYFQEISRVLRMGGRYLCISLLQEHILKYVIEYFPKHSFMLRIVHCLDAERSNKEKNADNPDAISMPVFALVATKFKALTLPVSIKKYFIFFLFWESTSNVPQCHNFMAELLMYIISHNLICLPFWN